MRQRTSHPMDSTALDDDDDNDDDEDDADADGASWREIGMLMFILGMLIMMPSEKNEKSVVIFFFF